MGCNSLVTNHLERKLRGSELPALLRTACRCVLVPSCRHNMSRADAVHLQCQREGARGRRDDILLERHARQACCGSRDKPAHRDRHQAAAPVHTYTSLASERTPVTPAQPLTTLQARLEKDLAAAREHQKAAERLLAQRDRDLASVKSAARERPHVQLANPEVVVCSASFHSGNTPDCSKHTPKSTQSLCFPQPCRPVTASHMPQELCMKWRAISVLSECHWHTFRLWRRRF